MIKRRYQAFVSSTYTDLIEERKEVTQAILENDCFPAGMELFPASNKKQWDVIKKVIDDSDFYILVIAGRYGSIGTDDKGNKISFTEMEFDYALKNNKPILAFLHKNIDALPRNKCELTEEGNDRLLKFRKKAEQGRVVKYWSGEGSLHAAVGNTISQMIQDEENEMVGWVPANMIDKESVKKSDSPQEKLCSLMKSFYDLSIVYRDALRNGDNDAFNNVVKEFTSVVQRIYYFYEEYRLEEAELADVAFSIVEMYNDHISCVQKYNEIRFDSPQTAIKYSKKAEQIFAEIVTEVVNEIYLLKNDTKKFAEYRAGNVKLISYAEASEKIDSQEKLITELEQFIMECYSNPSCLNNDDMRIKILARRKGGNE